MAVGAVAGAAVVAPTGGVGVCACVLRPRKPIDALNPENEKTVAFYAAVIMLGTVVVLAVAGLIMIILKALSIIDYLKGFF